MHDLTYRLVIATLRVAFAVLGLRIDVRGKEHIPVRGAAVIAANHNGYLDFAFVGLAATRRRSLVRFMAKEGTFDNPVSGPAMRAMRHIPVAREQGAGAYRRALRLLRGGELVCVFPEGTISRSWMLKDFLPGAVALAIERGVPIVPVVTWGGHRVLTVDLRRPLRRGTAVTIVVGEAIRPASRRGRAGGLQGAARPDGRRTGRGAGDVPAASSRRRRPVVAAGDVGWHGTRAGGGGAVGCRGTRS